MHLLDLPLDTLNLILENLEIQDLLHISASCQSMRDLLRPDHFIWLMENPQDDTATRDRAVSELSHLMRCHALYELFCVHLLRYDYAPLLQRGASFKPVPYCRILHKVFDACDPRGLFDFLISHGVSLHHPCLEGNICINLLLEDELRRNRRVESVEFLFRHGAVLRDVPSGLETLIDYMILNRAGWIWIEFVLEKGGPLRYTPLYLERDLVDTYSRGRFNDWVKYLLGFLPDGLDILLEYVLLRSGFGPELELLLREGPSFCPRDPSGAVDSVHGFFVRAVLDDGADLSLMYENGETPLIRAAGHGCTEVVRFLVKKGAPVNGANRNGWTPLHAAAEDGQNENIAVLLDAGANPNVTYDSRGQTPLQVAAFASRVEATRILTTCADLDHTNVNGWSALFSACFYASMETVMVLLDAGADPNLGSHDGFFPIHAAAASGDAEKVLRFIDEGIDPGTAAVGADNRGTTPLHVAAEKGYLDTVKTLIRHGASLTAVRDDGLSAADMAADERFLGVVSFLRGSAAAETDAGDGRTALHWACQNGQLDVVKYLVEHDADPGVADKEKATPIYLAAGKGYINIVQFLIEQGVDPDAGNEQGRSPIFAAAETGHVGALRLLIDHHARADPESGDGMRPLYMAVMRRYRDVVRILIENDADVNAKASDDMTALHMACAVDMLEMVELLVEHGADANAATKDGLTPLHTATVADSLDIIRFLIGHNGDVNAKTMSGKTPLHESATNGRLKATKLLIEAKADLRVRDRNGCTPLCCASRHGKLEAVKLLANELESGGAGLSSVTPLDDFRRTPLHWAVYRGHLDVATFLVEQGIDMSVVDSYGRTALDWACLARATLQGMVPANYESTPEDTQTQILSHSVASLSQDLLAGVPESRAANFHNIGHCLVLLEHQQSAQKCFLYQLASFSPGSDELMYRGACQICGSPPDSEPRRFICKICPELTLCAGCINTRPGCRGHTLLTAPCPAEVKDKRTWENGKMSDDSREWLEELVDRFGRESMVLR